jgi:hypothetical protein
MMAARARVRALERWAREGEMFRVRAREVEFAATTEDFGGVTLVAASAISKNTRVVTTPLKSWATRSSAFALDVAGRALDGLSDAKAKPTVALALHALNERRQTDDDASSSYAASMPADMDLVDSWDAARRATLRGTSTATAAANRERFIEEVRATLAATSFDVSLSDVSWALSMVSSRAVRSEVVPYAFVPGCDLLDHAYEPNCALGRDDASGDVFCVAIRDISGGESLTLSYGTALSNDRALRMYGFTMDGNPNDVRVMANGAWTATLNPKTSPPPAALVDALDILHAERASLELDDAAMVLLRENDASKWARNVAALRRGQLDIIDAHVAAL